MWPLWVFAVIFIAAIPLGVVIGAYLARKQRANEREQKLSRILASPRTEISIPRRAVSSGMKLSSMPQLPARSSRAVEDSPLWIDSGALAARDASCYPAEPPAAASHYDGGGGSFGGGGASASYDSSCDSSDSGSGCDGGGGGGD